MEVSTGNASVVPPTGGDDDVAPSPEESDAFVAGLGVAYAIRALTYLLYWTALVFIACLCGRVFKRRLHVDIYYRYLLLVLAYQAICGTWITEWLRLGYCVVADRRAYTPHDGLIFVVYGLTLCVIVNRCVLIIVTTFDRLIYRNQLYAVNVVFYVIWIGCAVYIVAVTVLQTRLFGADLVDALATNLAASLGTCILACMVVTDVNVLLIRRFMTGGATIDPTKQRALVKTVVRALILLCNIVLANVSIGGEGTFMNDMLFVYRCAIVALVTLYVTMPVIVAVVLCRSDTELYDDIYRYV